MARRPGVRPRAPRAIFLSPGNGRRLFAQPPSRHRLLIPTVLLVAVSLVVLLLSDLLVAAFAAVVLVAALLAFRYWSRSLKGRP